LSHSTSGSKRQQCATIKIAPDFSDAAHIFSASRAFIAIGFSTSTWTPALSAAIVCGACR
jgi:hypothetical protein